MHLEVFITALLSPQLALLISQAPPLPRPCLSPTNSHLDLRPFEQESPGVPGSEKGGSTRPQLAM